MSRLNYLTDTELALDSIDRELKLLERLVAGSVPLDAPQVQALTEYRDRITKLLAQLQPLDPGDTENSQLFEPSSSPQPGLPSKANVTDQSSDDLRRLILECLGESVL